MSKGPLQKLLSEPLLHFLVLGSVLFLLYALTGDVDEVPRDRIVVDEARITRLAEQFQRTWMRPPTRAELRGLAEDYVKEEILYREALALGLDRDDLVIRRRLRQKMEFLNTDLVDAEPPTDAELEAYLAANPDMFRRPDRFHLRQIYFDPAREGTDAADRARRVLARLGSEPSLDTDPQALADPTLLPPVLENVTARDIASTFGGELAEAVLAGGRGEWSGPFRSAYGLHLAHLTLVEPGGVPALAEARAAVEREWANARRQAANEHFYDALRGRYTIEIRLPDAAAGGELAISR